MQTHKQKNQINCIYHHSLQFPLEKYKIDIHMNASLYVMCTAKEHIISVQYII